MLRDKLKDIEGKRSLFRATFDKFEVHSRKGYPVERALFVDLRGDHGEEVCDHIWLRKGKQIIDLNLASGDQIEFYATSSGYWSGYHDNEHYNNFGLSFPRKIRKVPAPSPEVAGLPLFDLTSTR
jgi:hypothetical protein